MVRVYWGRKASGMCIVCPEDGTVLLLKRSTSIKDSPGIWGVPGGAVDAGGFSTPDHDDPDPPDDMWYASALREVYEEMSIEPDASLLESVTYRDGGFAYRTYVVAVSMKEKIRIDEDLFLDRENEETGWFRTLPEPLHFGVKFILKSSAHLQRILGIANLN
jgi:8-oxo-dGTP pyrophosphatase MutT (NUDIX family)